jgi:acyl carrier protein
VHDNDDGSTEVFMHPRTPTEQRLAAIWCEVLAIDRVGINDTFLDVGGESILATQCVNRIRAVYGVELTPQTLFSDDATIAGLAKIIDQSK